MADTIATGIKLDFSLLQQGLDVAIQQSRLLSRNFDEAVRKSLDLADIFTGVRKALSPQQFKEVTRTIRGTANEINRAVRQLENFENRLKRTLATLQARPGDVKPVATIREIERALATVSKLKQEFASFSIRERGGLPPELSRLPSILGDLERRIQAATTAERGLIRQFEQATRQLDRFKARWDNILKSIQAAPAQAGANRYIRAYSTEIQKAIAQTERFKQELISAFNVGPGAFQRTLKQTEADLSKLEVRLRSVRQAVLDSIRGRELSAISRAMATYPFSAHELAKPAEIITTTLTTQGIRPTLRAWWAASREIAAQEGRSAAAVFTRSFGQYTKQQFTRAFGAWLGAAFITFPLFYGTIEAIRGLNQAYNDLVEVSRYVQSATMQVGGQFEDLGQIMRDVIDLAVKTGVSFREAGKVLWEFRSAGFGAEAAKAGAEVALKLAQLGDVSDYGKAARIVAGVYRLFRNEVAGLADESERLKDIFGRVVFILNRSQISVDELLRSFEYFGATAKATGMDLNTMLAILSVLSDERLPGVGRAARQAMNQIAQAIPVLAAKYGIVLDANKTLAEQIPVVFRRLSKMFKEGAASLAEFALWMQEAGIRGGPAVLALARNWEIVERRMKILQDSAEYLGMSWREVFDVITETRMDYFTKQWERLKNVLAGLVAEGIHPLKQALADLLKVLIPVAEQLRNINTGTLVGGGIGYLLGGPFGGAVGALGGTAIYNLNKMVGPRIIEDATSRAVKIYSESFRRGRTLPSLLFTIDLSELDRKWKEDSVKIAAIINYEFRNIVESLGIPESEKKKILDKFLLSPDEVYKYLRGEKGLFGFAKGGLPPEKFQQLIEERRRALAAAVNIPAEAAKNFAKSGEELQKVFANIDEMFSNFMGRISAAVSGRRGAQIAVRNIQDFGKAFASSVEQFINAERLLAEAKATGDVELAKRAEEIARSAYISSSKALDNTLNAVSTFKRIYGEALNVAYGYRKDQADQLNIFLEKVENFRRMQRIFLSGAGAIASLRKRLEELANTANDPALKQLLYDLAESLGQFTKLDFSKAESSAISEFLEGVSRRARGMLPRSPIESIREQISEVDILLEQLNRAKIPASYRDKVNETRRFVEDIKKKLEETIPLRLKEVELANARLQLEVLAADAFSRSEKKVVELKKLRLWYEEQILDIQRRLLTAAPEEVNILKQRMQIIDELFRKRVQALTDPWYEYRENVARIMDSLRDRLDDIFVDWLANMKFNLDSLVQLFRRAAAEIVVEWFKMIIKMRLKSASGDFLGGLLGAIPLIGGLFKGSTAASSGPVEVLTLKDLNLVPAYHQGGVVGETPTPMRLVPSYLFNNAPRLHSGLLPNEFPAILERGEVVIPKNTPIGGQQNVFIIYAIDSQSFEEVVRRNPGAIVNVVMDNIKNNNELAYEIRGAL